MRVLWGMKRLVLLLPLVILLMPQFVQGQRLMDRKRPEIIPSEGKVRRGGFYFAPGITYTLPRNGDEREVYRGADTSLTATYDAHGRLGLYLEAGWYHATRDPIILDYWDIGLAYKNLRGSEESFGILRRGELVDTLAGEGAFAERMITFHVNANKFIQTADHQFIQLSLGVNVDHRIGADHGHTAYPIFNDHRYPPDLLGQAHFKLGYGFKLTGSLLLIPAVETPIFSVMPEDEGRFGALQWFSSTYRPLIFSVRFLWLRAPKGFDCPPPIRQPGEKKAGKRKQYKQDGYHP